MKQQTWLCVVCRMRGAVEYEGRVDVGTMARLIVEDHATRSPQCEADPYENVRIKNPAFSPDEFFPPGTE